VMLTLPIGMTMVVSIEEVFNLLHQRFLLLVCVWGRQQINSGVV